MKSLKKILSEKDLELHNNNLRAHPDITIHLTNVEAFTPSPNTIYQEQTNTLIMVVSQDLYGLELSPDGLSWYGKFGQEHYYNTVEGGTITFFVPKGWFWRFSGVNNSTNSNFSNQYWLKFHFGG